MNNEKKECQRCKAISVSLHKYKNSDPWLCPSCYMELNLDHTPQTHWNDNEINWEKKYKELREHLLTLIPPNSELTEKRKYFIRDGKTASDCAHFSYGIELIQNRLKEILKYY